MGATSVLWAGYPKSWTRGRNRKVQYVVLHYTAGSEGPTSAEGGVAYDKRRTDGTSTHYFTDSAGPALQEVPDGDRSHAARYHGNEIGIQIEICGTRQTREQWLDAVSRPTLETTAWLVATLLKRHGLAFKLLTIAETRAAYYAPVAVRPTGITDHSRCTQAYPEDNGDHMDVGTAFPWDVFMAMVAGFYQPPPPTDNTGDDQMFLLQGDDTAGYNGQPIMYVCNGVERVALTGLNNGSPNSYGAFQPYTRAGMMLITTNTKEAQAASRTMAEQLDAIGGRQVLAFTQPQDILAAIQAIGTVPPPPVAPVVDLSEAALDAVEERAYAASQRSESS